MNIYEILRQRVIAAAATLEGEGFFREKPDLGVITVERPKDPAHGEVATNAAVAVAASGKRAPRDIAEALARQLISAPEIVDARIAGPGFINLTLKEDVWLDVVRASLESPSSFGKPENIDPRYINLEFVSANPTGPLHLGHARGAVYGDALARLLEFAGHRVEREYYVNDAGAQVNALARSAYVRYLQAIGRETGLHSIAYQGDYLRLVGEGLVAQFGDEFLDRPEADWLEPVRSYALAAMLGRIQLDLALLGIQMDRFTSERELQASDRIQIAVGKLQDRGMIYEGILDPPKGMKPEGWEPRRQKLFRSTRYGDDVDRPIAKSDGSWTYFASDIAYHDDKIDRGYDELINVFGADHSGYCKRVGAIVSVLSNQATPLDIKVTQLVKVVERGVAKTMSKRAGEFVELSEAVQAVGADVTRFVMLMRRNDATLEFDFEEVKRQSKENPVFYVHYAHARICSLLRRASEIGMDVADRELARADLGLLNHPAQIALARRIAELPRVVGMAARSHEPHRVAFFVNEVAAELHSLWNRCGPEPQLRFIQEEDSAGTTARLALARSAAIAIANCLAIMGIAPMQEMRD